jgi:hypothetical protein
MCPDTASSLTPLSIHVCRSSRHTCAAQSSTRAGSRLACNHASPCGAALELAARRAGQPRVAVAPTPTPRQNHHQQEGPTPHHSTAQHSTPAPSAELHAAGHLVDGDAGFVVVYAAQHQVGSRGCAVGAQQRGLERVKALRLHTWKNKVLGSAHKESKPFICTRGRAGCSAQHTKSQSPSFAHVEEQSARPSTLRSV